MKNIHKTHNVLGRYCWTCNVKTESGLPGWTKPNKGGLRYSPWASNEYGGICEAVIWANGDTESKKSGTQCAMCDKHCKYPVSRSVGENGDTYMLRNKADLRG